MQRWASRAPWLNVILLFAILAGVAVGVWLTSAQLLLNTLLANERQRLAQAAEIQALHLETRPEDSMARPVPGSGKQYGTTGEVIVARLQGDGIEFVTDADADTPVVSLPADSGLAGPMQRAVQGQTGTMVGLDYRGERVIAAYRPISGQSLGVVVKIDLAEVRGTLRQANAIGLPVSIAIIAFGGLAFALAGQPLQRRALGTEHRFARLVETMTEGVAVIDANGNVAYANRRYSEILGRPREELIGKPFRAHLNLAQSGPHSEGVSGEDFASGPVELSILAGSGAEADVLATRQPIGGRQTGGSGSVVILTDITELRRAERKAQQEGERAQRYLDAANVIFVGLDIGGRVETINRSGLDALGYDEGELDGAEWVSICIPDDERSTAGAVFERLLSGAAGPLEYHESPILTRSGERRLIAWHTTILRDPDGRISGTLSSGMDVTERRRAEDLLRLSEDQYRSLFENAALGIYRTTPNGRILATNQTALRMLGFASFQELADRNLEAEGYEPTYPRAQYKERMERDGEITGFESAWIRKDGSTLYVRENAKAMRDANGNVLFYEGTIEDISAEKEAEAAKKELEARLIHTQKLESVGTLAGGVAHEINNPLTGVINYAQLIHDRTDDDQLRGFAQEIIGEGTRVAVIVRSLLSFSRQDKKQHSPASMADIVESTLSLIGSVLRKDQIQLTVKVAPELPLLRCRSQQIQQILINLLTNARDALNRRYPGFDEDKILTMTVSAIERDGSPWIRTVVEDHGGGIPADIVERIFDPFFSTKPRYESSGLGLSISYGLVRDHRGRLSVETEPGELTRFIMDLPTRPDDPLIG